jgi:spermidine synthase
MKAEFRPIEILSLTFILAFCSIIYELLLANTLGIMTGDQIFWQSVTIGIYIGGLGVGASRAARQDKPYEELYGVEWALSIMGLLCVVLLYFLHGGMRATDFLFYLQYDFYSPAYVQQSTFLKGLFFLAVQSITFMIGYFSGYEIPVLMKAMAPRFGDTRDNQVLGVNYIGTLFGALAFAFIFLPKLDVLLTSVVIGSLNFLVCIYLLIRRQVSFSPTKVMSLVTVAAVLSAVVFNINKIEQNYLKTYYLFKRYASNPNRTPMQFFNDISRFRPVERIKSPYQYIDIFHPELLNVEEFVLAIDTNFQFSSHNERFYHEGFAHIPINMTGVLPRKVLVLGGGDGLLKRELLKYPSIEHITHIELDPVVLELARNDERFVRLNERSLENPRVHTLVTDAFYYLRNTKEIYDAIFIDFPYPNNYNLARLYSVEFYRFVKKRLAPHGFVILDAPLHNQVQAVPSHMQGQVTMESVFREQDRLSNSILLSTGHFAGFSQLFPFKVGEESFLLMANLDRPFNYHIDQADLSHYEVITPQHLREVMRQDFPHRIRQSYVNSIFKPRLQSAMPRW